MTRVKLLSNLEINFLSKYDLVEEGEEIILLDVFQKSDLEILNLQNRNIPVIAFVKGAEFILDSKIDDYIIYPFSEKELEIRIQVAINKFNNKAPSNINFDTLTGLYNKYYFYSCCQKAINLGTHFSIAMIDLDNFKKINDLQGHLKGDESLKRAAKIFKYSIRNSDILARFGGDEFILMLPETSTEGALSVGERICKAIEKECKVSIGVASITPEDSLEGLINKADKALYAAKEQGGNKVVKA